MEFATRHSVKAFLRTSGKRVSNGVYETLDAEIEVLLKKACKRAEANGRTTVMPMDL